ncbi:hypothetical protein A3C05_03645 [Candidatus Giovannonibacteria bacterium RIFCSPHIGHO2_02_FULL_45_40]|uniref:Acetyl-CoA acetyltransferase n=1 Tax=Candidatus Giovannonibacteria bacterium RIFCSPHIGHO2_02_FULL_45_40 TaxID=1798337 RepID=A0A1F5W8V2_9BACT|nr:MAG: hypothetical protein A3C05_03645 [Candidatus Giovannonibacteria bacterium RIFCSPHIGHO2_02_FULL_45_40]
MAHSKKHTVIVGAKRTPVLKARGKWHNVSAIDLGAAVIGRLLKGKVPEPDQVIMGTFANPREWLNPAKAACATAGFEHLNAFTVNTVCNSGLVAAIIGDAFIKAGAEDCVMAGGMENLLSLSDEEILSLLRDPQTGEMTWHAGDWCARTYGISRKDQDDLAVESYKRARTAYRRFAFGEEIVPFRGQGVDEEPFWKVNEEMIRGAELVEGCETITALNASKNAGGAAAVMMTNQKTCGKYGLEPLAYIVSCSSVALGGDWKKFTIAPPFAILEAIGKAKLYMEDIDFFFINTAFGSVTIHASRELGMPLEKINPNGDAVSIGHPIGASGAKLLVEAVWALKKLNKRHAVISLCNAPGEAAAMVIKNAMF